MNNKRGQALVEFVIILPIFVFMVLAIIDVGKIIYIRNEMENELSNVIDLYRNKKTYDEILKEVKISDQDINLEIKNDDNEKVTFYLKKDVEIVTPGLNVVFDNPYVVEVKRVISYE